MTYQTKIYALCSILRESIVLILPLNYENIEVYLNYDNSFHVYRRGSRVILSHWES